MRASVGQSVNYIDAEGKSKPGVIKQVLGGDVAIVDHATDAEREKGVSHTAHATHDPDKKRKNSWHAVSDGNGAPAAQPQSKKEK